MTYKVSRNQFISPNPSYQCCILYADDFWVDGSTGSHALNDNWEVKSGTWDFYKVTATNNGLTNRQITSTSTGYLRQTNTSGGQIRLKLPYEPPYTVYLQIETKSTWTSSDVFKIHFENDENLNGPYAEWTVKNNTETGCPYRYGTTKYQFFGTCSIDDGAGNKSSHDADYPYKLYEFGAITWNHEAYWVPASNTIARFQLQVWYDEDGTLMASILTMPYGASYNSSTYTNTGSNKSYPYATPTHSGPLSEDASKGHYIGISAGTSVKIYGSAYPTTDLYAYNATSKTYVKTAQTISKPFVIASAKGVKTSQLECETTYIDCLNCLHDQEPPYLDLSVTGLQNTTCTDYWTGAASSPIYWGCCDKTYKLEYIGGCRWTTPNYKWADMTYNYYPVDCIDTWLFQITKESDGHYWGWLKGLAKNLHGGLDATTLATSGVVWSWKTDLGEEKLDCTTLAIAGGNWQIVDNRGSEDTYVASYYPWYSHNGATYGQAQPSYTPTTADFEIAVGDGGKQYETNFPCCPCSTDGKNTGTWTATVSNFKYNNALSSLNGSWTWQHDEIDPNYGGIDPVPDIVSFYPSWKWKITNSDGSYIVGNFILVYGLCGVSLSITKYNSSNQQIDYVGGNSPSNTRFITGDCKSFSKSFTGTNSDGTTWTILITGAA